MHQPSHPAPAAPPAQPGLAALLEPQNLTLLNKLTTLGPYSADLGQKLDRSLRKKGFAPDLVAALLTQLELRTAGAAKFGDFAARMLFTRTGLEQATRLSVAALHAGRFRAAGCTKVADLGCGLGADSLALAALGLSVWACDIDEATAALATVNLLPFAATPGQDVSVHHADAVELPIADLTAQGVDGVFADPARRGARGRLRDPESWSPPLSAVLAWAGQVPGGRVGAKVAPGIAYDALPPGAGAQWVSVDGTLVEACLWLGNLAHVGIGAGATRSAVVMRSAVPFSPTEAGASQGADPNVLPLGQKNTAGVADRERHDAGRKMHTNVLVDAEGRAVNAPAPAAPVSPVSEYLLEPDSAVTRAGLVAQLAAGLGAGLVSDKIAYLSAPSLPGSELSPFVSAFRVLEVVPLQVKPLRKALTKHNFGALEVKKRGTDISPDKLRKDLLAGRKLDKTVPPLTVFATRVAGKHQAILAQRI